MSIAAFDVLQILAGGLEPRLGIVRFDLDEREPASDGPSVAPNGSRVVAFSGMRGHIVNQDDAQCTMRLGVAGFAEELRVLGIHFAGENALVVELLRLVAQDQYELAFRVEAGVVVVVVFGSSDAVSGEYHRALQTCPWRKS